MNDVSEDVKWAWIAGLYEGEGSVAYTNKMLRFSLKSTDYDVIEKLASIAGGTIRGPYNYQYKDGYIRKPHWLWHSDGQSTRMIYERIKPHLCSRRHDRIEELLSLGYRHANDRYYPDGNPIGAIYSKGYKNRQ